MLALFDQHGAAVFAVASRLTDGDEAAAQALVIAAYRRVTDDVDRSNDGLLVDCDELVDAAHIAFVASDEAGHIELAVASLHEVEHRTPAEIARSLGLAADEVSRVLAAARSRYAPVLGESTGDALRRNERWFDDERRTEARAALVDPAADATTTTPGTEPPSRPARRRLTTRATLGLLAVPALIIGLAVRATSTDVDTSTSGSTTTVATTPTTNAGTIVVVTTTDPVATSPSTASPNNTATTDAADSTDTTEAPALDDGFPGAIFDPLPAGYELDLELSYPATTEPGGWLEVWATPGATRLTGRWLAVQLQTADSYEPLLPEVFGDGSIAPRIKPKYSTDADGVAHGFVTVATGQPVLVAGFGFTDDEFATVVESLTVDRQRRPAYGSASASFFDGLQLSVAGFSNTLAIDQATYRTASGSSVTIRSSAQRENDLLTTALVGAPLDLSATGIDVVSTTLGGRTIVSGDATTTHDSIIGGTPADPPPPPHFVQWHRGIATITIFGDASIDELLAVAGFVRPATAAEWHPEPLNGP